MKFMLIVKASKESEAGEMPSVELLNAMGKFNEELVNAGVMLDGGGLTPSSKGARVTYIKGKPVLTDGPFAETKELVAGFWVLDVKSREEAIQWAMKCPPTSPHGTGQIEVRKFFESADFDPSSEAVQKEPELERRIAEQKKNQNK